MSDDMESNRGMKMKPDVTATMLEILRLDPGASVELSTWTGKWLVQSCLSVGNGTFIQGIAEHRDTPEEAVHAFWERLCSHETNEYITNGRSGENRKNWRRLGVMFREVSTEDLISEYRGK